MYLGIIPYTLVLRNIPAINPGLAITVYMIIMHVPVLALYVRRCNDMKLKKTSILFLSITLPIISAIIFGVFPTYKATDKNDSGLHSAPMLANLLALSFALTFYGGMVGLALFENPEECFPIPVLGILLGTGAVFFELFFDPKYRT